MCLPVSPRPHEAKNMRPRALGKGVPDAGMYKLCVSRKRFPARRVENRPEPWRPPSAFFVPGPTASLPLSASRSGLVTLDAEITVELPHDMALIPCSLAQQSILRHAESLLVQKVGQRDSAHPDLGRLGSRVPPGFRRERNCRDAAAFNPSRPSATVLQVRDVSVRRWATNPEMQSTKTRSANRRFFAAAFAVRERDAEGCPGRAPRRPNAERVMSARGQENHTRSRMLRGEQTPIRRVWCNAGRVWRSCPSGGYSADCFPFEKRIEERITK